MRNNLLIFALGQFFLILIFSVFLIYLHLSSAVEEVVYDHFALRLIPVIFAAAIYLFLGKFMNVRGFTDSLLTLLLPALIWGIFLAIAHFGGGNESFVRGAFRSLWRFPADVTMLPQMAALSLLRLNQSPAVYAGCAIIPQVLSILAAAKGPAKYRSRRKNRRNKK